MKKSNHFKTKKINFLGEEMQLCIKPCQELNVKKNYPWCLKISIEKKYKGSNPKFIYEEKKKCSSIIRKIEYTLSKSIKFIKTAKINKESSVVYIWYLNSAEIDYSKNVKQINRIKSIRNFIFDINYDVAWDRVNSLVKKEVA